MAAVFSKELEIFSAKQFKESVSEPTSSNVYLTFGRSYAWANDSAPPQATSSSNTFYDVWNNMIGAKRITGNDIRHCIPRFNWTANTVYTAYDDQIDSRTLKNSSTKFYVITDDWNVYKCLANNYGVSSTSKPTSISTTSDFQTSDGYIWKYMYTVTAEERLRYVTNNYIPVKTLTVNDGSLQWGVQNNSVTGAIHNILLTNFGSGYTSNNISIIITGDGSAANAFAVRNVTANTISSIVIDNKGFNYTRATVTISSTSGSNAAARAIISPPDGHGSDPLTELGGSNLVINAQFKSNENGKFPVVNEYRQISMIEDPYKYGGTNVSSNISISQLTVLSLTGVSAEYIEDENVYQGSSLSSSSYSAKVVEWDSANNKLKVNNVTGTQAGVPIIGETSGAARFVAENPQLPDLQPYSGKLLYIDNVKPISRTIDQTEDFKIILNF